MKNIFKFISRYSFLFILMGYIAINILFLYQTYWRELIFDRSKNGAGYGEVQVTELYMDKIYNNLISGNNPFSPITGILYPFNLDIVGSDPGFAFNLIFFRQFFSIHQSLSLIIIANLFLANLGMYFLLRKLGFERLIAFLIGLAYGFTTYLTVRLIQVDYSVLYLFPWFFFSFFSFLKANNKKTKIVSTVFISFFFSLTLWQNMYYFTILLVICSFFILYLFFVKPKTLFIFIKKNIYYLCLFVIFGIFINIPWLIVLKDTMLFSQTPRSMGWNGAASSFFSSDLFNYFIPSGANYYYGKISGLFLKKVEFAKNIFENFTYPGVIILVSYFFLFIYWKKYPKELLKLIKPYLYASLVIIILTLGPFLHIAGRWFVQLDDGIRVVFPLPYIFLHYLPFLGHIRVPGRLIIGFIFFAYIVCSYLLAYFLKKKSLKFKFIFVFIFLTIFIIDHRMLELRYLIPKNWPNKIYDYIRKDPAQVSVLEIPFTVRDGFTYFGDSNALFSVYGESFHKKPVLGAYAGRIPNYIKDYYQKNELTGYLGRMIDSNWQNNPFLAGQDIKKWDKLDLEKAKDTLDFLNLKYIIQDNKKEYNASVSAVLSDLGFEKTLSDQDYLLWQNKPQNKEFLGIDMSQDSDLFLGFGWYDRENDFRWMDRRGMIMFKVEKKRKLILNLRAESFNKNIKLSVYLNKNKAGEVEIGGIMKDYQIDINKDFDKGINYVYFISDKAYMPAKIISGSLDQRKLSAKFTKIYLTDK